MLLWFYKQIVMYICQAFEFFLGVGGATFAFWFEYGLAKTNNNFLAWRFPLAFQLVFLVIVIVAINFFPESPRWLAKVGRFEESRFVSLI